MTLISSRHMKRLELLDCSQTRLYEQKKCPERKVLRVSDFLNRNANWLSSRQNTTTGVKIALENRSINNTEQYCLNNINNQAHRIFIASVFAQWSPRVAHSYPQF